MATWFGISRALYMLRCTEISQPVSLTGHNPTASLALACPLTPGGADIPLHWLYAAMCQKRTNALQQTTPLFDHLVGEREQRGRKGNVERPSCIPTKPKKIVPLLTDTPTATRCRIHGAFPSSEEAGDQFGKLGAVAYPCDPIKEAQKVRLTCPQAVTGPTIFLQ